MSVQKKITQSKKTWRVTFDLPEHATNGAKSVKLLGQFNNWEKDTGVPLELKNGHFSATLVLQPGQELEFRYLLDDNRWENDSAADKYVPTPFGVENSVVIVGESELKD